MFEFKKKYQPVWQGRYLAFRPNANLLLVALALVRVHLPQGLINSDVRLAALTNTHSLFIGHTVITIQTLPPTIPLIGRTFLLEARVANLQNTVAVNLAGNRALAIPIPVGDGAVPVTSLQLVGRPFSEAELLNAGRLVEASIRGRISSVIARPAPTWFLCQSTAIS